MKNKDKYTELELIMLSKLIKYISFKKEKEEDFFSFYKYK